MARRSTSMLDDLMDIAEVFPWWIGFLLAIGSYFLFHWISIIDIGSTSGSSNIVWFFGIKILAMVFQYLFPMALGAGALVSGVKQWKRHKVYERQTSIEKIRNLSWRQFEGLISEAFRNLGYQVTETDEGADGGVDLILGKDGKNILVQCKHWKKWKVGVDKVRELNGIVAARGAYSGILVTSGVFTVDARKFAKDCPIELYDCDSLVKLIPHFETRHNQSDDIFASPSCPKCGGSMDRQLAKRGYRKGKYFWGCTKFPDCNGLINIDN